MRRNAVGAAYKHALHLEPRAKIVEDWANFLERIQRGGKVLPFRGKPRDRISALNHTDNPSNREGCVAIAPGRRREFDGSFG